MAIFGSKEEKLQQKEMKKQQKEQEIQQKLELKEAEKYAKQRAKLAEHGLEDIDDEYMQACLNVFTGLMGTGMMKAGSHLKTEDTLNLSYLEAIMDQNWIMIRQLNRIIRALEK